MKIETALLERKSIRKYTEEEIPTELLVQLLEFAKHAPTGRNNQGIQFYALKNPYYIEEMEEVLAKELDEPTYSLRGAKAFILTLVHRDNKFSKQDTACAMMNIHYGAMAKGLGACWINQMSDHCDGPYLRAFLEKLDVPSEYVSYGMMALGYPDEDPEPKERSSKTRVIE